MRPMVVVVVVEVMVALCGIPYRYCYAIETLAGQAHIVLLVDGNLEP